MFTPYGRSVELDKLTQVSKGAFSPCKDFLCPVENRVKEWFPTLLMARIRAQTLDPFGYMKNAHQKGYRETHTKNMIINYYKCQDEKCHARLVVRKVRPDKDGNSYGLYGCITHQHPLLRNKRSEIFFKNKVEAQDFFDINIKRMYTNGL